MAAYVVVEITTRDPGTMARYREIARPIVEAHGGRYLARGGATRALEGGWEPERLVILEFPDMARAVAWWECAEYAEARDLRQRAGETRMVVVEGLPPGG